MIDLFTLIASMVRRVITAISTPFRLLIVRGQRLFNVNLISAKLIQPLTSNVKKLLQLQPTEKSDYVKIGRFLVFKQLLMALVLALCAGVFIYFQMFAGQPEAAPTTVTEIKTNITFRYDDIKIKDFSGVANITAYDGNIVYTGEIENGVCKGYGYLYSRQGALIYEGSFEKNRYHGYGISYSPEGGTLYEGMFADNLYNGAGKIYTAAGTRLYEGNFKNGLYDGTGTLYDEKGNLLYEGSFAAGGCHGTGTQYYPDGTTHYVGDFFEGAYQGTGSLYGKNGQLLYTGTMYNGGINYRALVGATLMDIETAFQETPVIYYYDDGNSCFFYEKAGVIITTDCKVKVYEWERPKDNPSDGYYYLPNGGESNAATTEEQLPAYDGIGNIDGERPPVQVLADRIATSAGLFSRPARDALVLTNLSWVIIDPNGTTTVPTTPPAATEPTTQGTGRAISEEPAGVQIPAPRTSEPATSAGSPPVPDFIEKTKELYFEIDKDVWCSEELLDKSKVFIKRVTVLESAQPREENVTQIDDNAPAGVEDCVAIDSIRKRSPTAFSDVGYEMDKQNKLFQRIWNINYANRIVRKSFLSDDVFYHYCYQTENDTAPLYYSIEG